MLKKKKGNGEEIKISNPTYTCKALCLESQDTEESYADIWHHLSGCQTTVF